MLNGLLDLCINYFYMEKWKSMEKTDILPREVLNRPIKFYNGDKLVFESNKAEEVPISVQYTMKKYGIPKDASKKRNKPIIYRINTTFSSKLNTEEFRTTVEQP